LVQVCLSRSPVREGLTSVNALAREVEPLWILWTRWKTPGGRFRARAARVQRGASASTSSAPPTCCRSGSSSRPTRCSNGPSPLRRKRPHVRPGRVRRQRPRRRLARTPSQQFGRLLHPDRRTEPARFGSRGDIRERPSRSSTGSKTNFSERHGGYSPHGLSSRIASASPSSPASSFTFTRGHSGVDWPRATTQGINRLAI